MFAARAAVMPIASRGVEGSDDASRDLSDALKISKRPLPTLQRPAGNLQVDNVSSLHVLHAPPIAAHGGRKCQGIVFPKISVTGGAAWA